MKPFTAIAASGVVGFLVMTGLIDPSVKDATTELVDALIGGVVVVITAGAALYRYVVKHPHGIVVQGGKEEVKVETPTVTVPVNENVADQPQG